MLAEIHCATSVDLLLCTVVVDPNDRSDFGGSPVERPAFWVILWSFHCLVTPLSKSLNPRP